MKLTKPPSPKSGGGFFILDNQTLETALSRLFTPLHFLDSFSKKKLSSANRLHLGEKFSGTRIAIASLRSHSMSTKRSL
jgi:hypothetical protein